MLQTETRYRGDAVMRHGLSEPAMRVLDSIYIRTESPADKLLRSMEPWSRYAVLPIFALANAGVIISLNVVETHGNLMLAIILGLVVGKPVGMLSAAWLAVRIGLAAKPAEYSWRQLAGARPRRRFLSRAVGVELHGGRVPVCPACDCRRHGRCNLVERRVGSRRPWLHGPAIPPLPEHVELVAHALLLVPATIAAREWRARWRNGRGLEKRNRHRLDALSVARARAGVVLRFALLASHLCPQN